MVRNRVFIVCEDEIMIERIKLHLDSLGFEVCHFTPRGWVEALSIPHKYPQVWGGSEERGGMSSSSLASKKTFGETGVGELPTSSLPRPLHFGPMGGSGGSSGPSSSSHLIDDSGGGGHFSNILPFPASHHQDHFVQGSTPSTHLASGPEGGTSTISEVEKIAIQRAIEQFSGNLTEAAKALDIGRATLYRKLKQYDLDVVTARKRKVAA